MVEFVKDVHVLYGGKLRCMNNEGLLVSKGSKDCMPFGLFHKRKGRKCTMGKYTIQKQSSVFIHFA